jgi:iron complex transport system permease protein
VIESANVRHARWWIAGGSAALIILMIVSLMLGAYVISPPDVVDWATGWMSNASNPAVDRVLSSIRLPRVLGAAILGGTLGIVGAVLQGTYRTPLADAQLLGYSSAAGVGAALGFALTPVGTFPIVPVFLAAAAGATYGALASVFRSRAGRDRFILAGVAFGFALLAWTGLFVLIVDSPRIPTLLFFVFGTLTATTWKVLGAAAIVLVPSALVLWRYGPGIDLLVLGDREATHVGFDAARVVPIVVAVVGVAVGASVALGGVVGFVGLIVPFLLRPFVGSTVRVLIPATAIGGAIVIVIADTLARTIAAPSEIPLGLITAAVGGPFLAWLLLRRRAT